MPLNAGVVERVEQARDAVEAGAGARVQRHVVEAGDGEHDAEVTCLGEKQLSASCPDTPFEQFKAALPKSVSYR